jgi:hypothetical protein
MHRERRVTGGAPGHFALGPFALSAASEPLRWLSAAMTLRSIGVSPASDEQMSM